MNPYDVVFSPNYVLGSGDTYQVAIFPRLVSFAANFSGSQGNCEVNPGADQTWTVKKNGSAVGTVTLSMAGAVTFASSGGAAVSYSPGDYMTITNQAGADTGLIAQLTFAGQR